MSLQRIRTTILPPAPQERAHAYRTSPSQAEMQELMWADLMGEPPGLTPKQEKVLSDLLWHFLSGMEPIITPKLSVWQITRSYLAALWG